MAVVRGLPRVFRDAKAILVESMVWRDGILFWCDISAGLLHGSRADDPDDGRLDAFLELPPPLASFAPAASGAFVASLGDRIVRIDGDGRILEVLAEVPHARRGLRLNEGKCDPYGRWITGSMVLTEPDMPDGALYSLAEGGELRVLRGGFGVANGFEWSLDDSQMYFTDTAVKTIYRASYSPEGELGDPVVFHSGESHDGLTIDAEGYLWSGIYAGGKVVRYAPDGTEDLSVELPAPNITSVTFGGDDMSTLFVGSARENLTEQQLEQYPLAGSIFAIDTATHGRAVREFGPTR